MMMSQRRVGGGIREPEPEVMPDQVQHSRYQSVPAKFGGGEKRVLE